MRFSVAAADVAVFAIGRHYRAISDMCLRCGASLAGGTPIDMTVRCGGCRWQYDLQTGEVLGVPGLRIEVFQIEIDQGRLRVATPSGLAGQSAES